MTTRTSSRFLSAVVLCIGLSAFTGTIALAQGQSDAPAGKFRVMNGPGGRQLIEVPMPEGFAPIRLVGLRGMPVTGHPVTERRGELNPQNWEQLDLGEVDTNFGRLLEALRVRAEPKLLQGTLFAESFARTHLDEGASKEFFVTGQATTFGSNEFERKALLETFLSRYEASLQSGLPTLPLEFVYIEQVLLGTYDAATSSFPISNAQGETNRTSLHSFAGAVKFASVPQIDVPPALPMEPGRAEALLARIPDARGASGRNLPPIRHVWRGMRIAITGFGVAQNRTTETQVEVRSIGLFEDPLLTRSIHEYEIQQQTASETVSLDAMTLMPHLPNLYAVRDLDGFLDEAAVATGTSYLLKQEQFQMDGRFMSAQCGEKHSVFEWSTARPDLANGPLLEALLDPAADWSFLDKESRFGLVADHCVDLLVFPRDKIAGRQVDFAAAEMAPVYRQSVEAAAKRLPQKVYITRNLYKPRYDHARKMLSFEEPAPGSTSRGEGAELLTVNYGGVEYLAPGDAKRSQSRSTIVAPKDAEGLAFYSMELALADNQPLNVPPLRPKSPKGGQHAEPGSGWRESVRWFRGERNDQPNALALDRRLVYPSVAVDPATAERLIGEAGSSGKSLRAVIVLDVEGVRRVNPDNPGILFARLDRIMIATSDGRTVAKVGAGSFPDAVAADRASKAAAEERQAAAAAAAEEKKAAQQAQAAEAEVTRSAGLAACDSKAASAQARLECYRAFCATRQGDYQCFSKVREAQLAANSERAGAAASSAVRRSECAMRARTRYQLTQGSPGYEQVVESCLSQAERSVYGPDILGLRLGMSRNDADLIRRRELNVRSGQMRPAADSPLFEQGTIFFSADESHLLAIENLDNLGRPLAALIGRRIHFGSGGQPADALLASMTAKYGTPVWRDGRHLLWAFDENGQAKGDASSQQCAKVAGMLGEPQWNGMSGRDDKISNLAPPGLVAGASRADFAALADCGVVLIARFQGPSADTVQDASMVLFDPAWIAEQPDIAFSAPAGKEGAPRF